PVRTVVVRVGDVNRRAAEAAELRPGDEQPPEVVPGAGARVDSHSLMIGKLSVRALLASVRLAGRDRNRWHPGGGAVAHVDVGTRVRLGRSEERRVGKAGRARWRRDRDE